MKTTERQPVHVREYDGTRKSAREIQNDLALIRIAYRDPNRRPMNNRRFHPMPYVTIGMGIGVILAGWLLF